MWHFRSLAIQWHRGKRCCVTHSMTDRASLLDAVASLCAAPQRRLGSGRKEWLLVAIYQGAAYF